MGRNSMNAAGDEFRNDRRDIGKATDCLEHVIPYMPGRDEQRAALLPAYRTGRPVDFSPSVRVLAQSRLIPRPDEGEQEFIHGYDL
jgi:hypothetical protein